MVTLANARSARALTSDLERAVVAFAGGNPQMVELFASATHLVDLGSERAALSTSALLRTVLGDLTPAARQVLAHVATSAGELAALVAAAAGGLRPEAFELAVRELKARRLLTHIERAAHDGPLLDTYHDRIREATSAELSDIERADHHRRLAMAFERVGGTTATADTLLTHWSGAGDRPKRLVYLRRAADEAAESLALVRAAELYEALLREASPGADHEPLRPHEVGPLWERCGDHWRLGGRRGEAADAYEAATAWWSAEPPGIERDAAILRMSGVWGECLLSTGDHARCAGVMDAGLRRVEKTKGVHAIYMTRSGLRSSSTALGAGP